MGRRRRTGDYHLLVAQNFLANISYDGTHNDTNLRIFNRPGIENVELQSMSRPPCAVTPLALEEVNVTDCAPSGSVPRDVVCDRPSVPGDGSVSAPVTARDPLGSRRFSRQPRRSIVELLASVGSAPFVPSGARTARSAMARLKQTSRNSRQHKSSLPEFSSCNVAQQTAIVGGTSERANCSETRKNSIVNGTPQKRSIFQRFTRIVSSDDVLMKDEELMRKKEGRIREKEDEERCGSPLSNSQNFAFLKRLKSSLHRGERLYLCSRDSSIPLVTVSHFGFGGKHTNDTNGTNAINNNNTGGSNLLNFSRRLHSSQERIRRSSMCSTEELRPFDFRDGEELTYGHLFHRRGRVYTLSGGERSPKKERPERDRRESVVGCSLLNVDSGGAGAVSRASSCDPSFPDALHLNLDELEEVEEEDVHTTPYDPQLLSEVERTRKANVRFNGFSSSLTAFASEEEMKKQMNEKFRSRFPNIQLTYSKFKSIKREVVSIAAQCDIDTATVALAFVYWEQIVLKGMISKYNRKLVAGVCFIVAVKVTDVGKKKVKDVIEVVEDTFRESRRELLAFEIPLCVALNFDLNPPPQHIKPHYDKLIYGTV